MKIEEKIDKTLNSIQNLDTITPENDSIDRIFNRLENSNCESLAVNNLSLSLLVIFLIVINIAVIFSSANKSAESENIRNILAQEYLLNYENEIRL